jgi:microcystin-dependent protein
MDPFLGEVRMFPFNFPPKNWRWCNGALMSVTQNTALFSLLGTFYGGDGKSTFALPNLQGAVAIHPGRVNGQGTERFLGEQSGADFVTLINDEMPAHTHQVRGSNVAGNRTRPEANSLARASAGSAYVPISTGSFTNLAYETFAPAGGSQPHNNLMPYNTLHYAICILGVYPPRP